MRTLVEDGGWYGDNDLQGNYVSLHRDSHLVINGTRIELPIGQWGKENLVQLVSLSWRGDILVAGQGQVGDRGSGNWLWKDGKWKLLGPSFGTFSCAFDVSSLYVVCGINLYQLYDLEGNKLSNTISRIIGANGIRYIDFSRSLDGIVTGDYTYGPSPYNLSQWIAINDLVIGQSYIDGCIALRKNIQYKIENGDTQFLRLHYDGKNVAITIVKMLENRTVFYWFPIEELDHQFPILNPPLVEKEKGPTNSSPSDNPIIKVPIKKDKKMQSDEYIKTNNLPTLDHWLHVEFIQLRDAFFKTRPNTPLPDDWQAFQTYRRFLEPDAWPFDRMLRHELGDDSENKPNPQ